MPSRKENKCCEVACAPACQKKLLKVVACLWNQYIINRTPLTDEFFADPTAENQTAMNTELASIQTLINGNPAVTALDDEVLVAITAADALGNVVYVSTDASGNPLIDASNVGVQKNIQRLNTDECLDVVFQVRPIIEYDDANNVSGAYTQVMVSQRTGCNGVSNTGFLSLYVNVTIENYPFNSCSTGLCLFDTCKPTPTLIA